MDKLVTKIEAEDGKEKISLPGPHLRYIEKTLELLRPIENELGEEINWKELYGEVKPWSNSLELADNIRETVRDYVALKIPKLKEKIPTFQDLKTIPFLNALAHNWVEEEMPEVKEQRREVLLAVIAQMVKRIETLVYKKTLEHASEEDMREKLGLDPHLRGLLIDLLDTCQRADPLFVRFLAFSFATPEAPKEATPTAIFVPGLPGLHTMAELFPHETLSISHNFQRILDNSQEWEGLSGADTFKAYLGALSSAYRETDPQKAEEYLKSSERFYEELLRSDFPIILSSGMSEGSYFKEPYVDPELKISISTRDTRTEEDIWNMAQRGMAESLSVIGADAFADEMRGRTIRSVVNIGGHGANLIFNNVADEEPGIVIFLNDQIRSYDRDFPKVLELIKNTREEFASDNPEEDRAFKERMSRSNTVHHELSHSVYKSSLPEAQRLGREPLTTIDEVKAEILYRALVPSMIDQASLAGNKRQWALAMLASSMQQMKDMKPDDWYYKTSVYAFNDLLAEGVVVFDGNTLEVTDFDRFYEVNQRLAEEVLALYRDIEMTELKAERWLDERCQPNAQTQALSDFLKDTFKLESTDANN